MLARWLVVLLPVVLAIVPRCDAALVFCVNAPGCVGIPQPTIAAAIEAASQANAPGYDHLVLGPGTYEGPVKSPGSPLKIVGAGPDQTTITMSASGGDSVVYLPFVDDSVKDLQIRIPAGPSSRGLTLLNGVAENVKITAGSDSDEPTGAWLENAARFRFGVVDLPTTGFNLGIVVTSEADVRIEDTHVSASIGIAVDGPSQQMTDATEATVWRSQIYAQIGLFALRGDIFVASTLIRALGAGAQVDADAFIRLRGVTLFGQPGALAGILMMGGLQPPRGVEVIDTVIRGFDFVIARDGGTVHLERSDFDPTKMKNVPGPFPGNQFSPDPLFVDEAQLDFRLRPGSPLIDAGGDGTAADESPTDLAGAPRVVDGNGDGVARSDIGAYEFQAPTTTTTLPSAEQCGNCRDDDGDQLVDFEDAECCARSVELTLQRGAVRPRKRGTALRLDAAVSTPQTDAAGAEVVAQVRTETGEVVHCLRAPAGALRGKGRVKRFRDPKHRVAGAGGLELLELRATKSGRTKARIKAMPDPGSAFAGETLQVTLAFRQPDAGEAAHTCARGSQRFRRVRKGLRLP